MADFKNRLVWSDDPKDKAAIEASNSPKGLAETPLDEINQLKWTCVFRLEKNGRGGKTVTVIDQLPRNEAYVTALCKELKSKCGSGGTSSVGAVGLIEIQGDKREAIKALFTKKGIRFKGM